MCSSLYLAKNPTYLGKSFLEFVILQTEYNKFNFLILKAAVLSKKKSLTANDQNLEQKFLEVNPNIINKIKLYHTLL